jgi:hypothetical protein
MEWDVLTVRSACLLRWPAIMGLAWPNFIINLFCSGVHGNEVVEFSKLEWINEIHLH